MDDTALDRAHAGMQAMPEDDAARLAFFDRLAGAELFLLLEREADGDAIRPEMFPIEDASYVAAFDTEQRLADFAGRPVPYVALSGRTLAATLSGRGLGLALNPDVAPSATVLSPETIAWLAATLASRPSQLEARPVSVTAPSGLPEPLLVALDAKLALATGLARHAWLAGVTYAGGRTGHLLAFVDAAAGAEPALARAVGEALTFSGVEAGEIDVAFFRASDPVSARIGRVGLKFDLPQAPTGTTRSAPGMDPDRPPRLR